MQPEKIAIILQCQGMGDCLYAMAVLRKLRSTWGKDAELVLFTRLPGLFARCPYVSEVQPIEAGHDYSGLDGFTKCLTLFDAARLPHYLMDTFDFLSVPAGIGELSFREKQLEYFPVEEDLSQPFDVVINTSITWPSRSWPTENWQAVADALLKAGRSVAVVGKDTWSEADGMMKVSPDLRGCTNLANRLSLDQTYYTIRNCGLFITGQNGLSVLAGATDTEIIVLDMSIEWSKRAIYRQEDPYYRVTYVKGNCPAYCCMGQKCPLFPEFRCIPTVPQVMAAIHRAGTTSRNAPMMSLPQTQESFSPARIAALDLALQYLEGGRHPMQTLDPGTLCVVDLPFVARGARRIAVLALGGPGNVLDGAALLATLRGQAGERRLRVFCPPGCAELLDGFEVQDVDSGRYARDVAYRESIARGMTEFSPELVVNLDPGRGIEADDLCAAAPPVAGAAFALPERGQDAALVSALNRAYTSLIPQEAGPEAMLTALGLDVAPPTLWPVPSTRANAQRVFERVGWESSRTLAVLVDDPSVTEEPAFLTALSEAAGGGWHAIGLGSRNTYRHLDKLLEPWGERAVNLAGSLDLGSTVALLQLCGGFLGGASFLGSVAKACGCSRIGSR
jgi:ADP-heptose:LPS heptosyltransferase